MATSQTDTPVNNIPIIVHINPRKLQRLSLAAKYLNHQAIGIQQPSLVILMYLGMGDII